MSLSEQDMEAIRTAIEKDAEAVRRADSSAVTQMFTADALRFPPGHASVRGRYELTIASGAGSTPVTDRGHYMGLLRKQAHGS